MVLLFSRFSVGKPTIAFAQRSEVGVESGMVFRFMTPGVHKYPYYKFVYMYVRNFVSSWPSHNSCCKEGQKWNVFECRPLHCYEAELPDICRQDSTYITMKVYWIWPSKTSRKKTRFREASSNVSVFGFEFQQKIAKNKTGKWTNVEKITTKWHRYDPLELLEKNRISEANSNVSVFGFEFQWKIAKNDPGKILPKTNLVKNFQKRTRQKIAKNKM